MGEHHDTTCRGGHRLDGRADANMKIGETFALGRAQRGQCGARKRVRVGQITGGA
ncbi:MAG: hypothetical protein H5U15_08220 [Roseovarius sp.]|nr:hypothetical protein [Roseovarius sp.]